MPARRVLVLSPTPALEAPGHAGARLVTSVVTSYRDRGDAVLLLAPSTGPTCADLARSSPVCTTRLLGRPRDYRGIRRALLTAAHRALPILQQWDPYLPWVPLVLDLVMGADLRNALRQADVIDLQWEEYGRLAPLVRRIAPRAAITCMFHDVNEQRASRGIQDSPARSVARSRRQHRRVRRTERRLSTRLDVAFVLSEKDRDILLSSAPAAPVCIVTPPLVGPGTPLTDALTADPTLGFVAAIGRRENREAALRLVRSIWPLIRAALPSARLVLVGGGLDDKDTEELARVPGVELTGFVDDLEAQYARFRATLSPISSGAGVKFKIVESIVRGIPTITTSVGIEGIEPDLAAAVTDDDSELADAAVDALQNDRAAERARSAALKARELYSTSRFREVHRAAVDEAVERRTSVSTSRVKDRRPPGDAPLSA